jgi:hypothetical protein
MGTGIKKLVVTLKTMETMMTEDLFIKGLLTFTLIYFTIQLVLAYFGGYL